MTKRTTDEWEALLNGTSKAPWKLHGIATFPNSPSGMWAPDLIPAAPGDGTTPNDGKLAAAAPEAAAEVVRLRRAIEDLIREVGAEDNHQAEDDWDRGAGAAYRDVTDTLTDILEGDDIE